VTAGTGATVRTVLDTGGGLVRRQVEVPPGAHHTAAAGPGGELCFVIEGAGQLSSAAEPGRAAEAGWPVQPASGVWLPPGTSYSLAATGPGPLRLDSVLLPAPAPGTEPGVAEPGGAGPLLAELADQAPEITGDRQFRVLFAPGQGCPAATQFVGEIPPGKAPFHSHTYDEVVLILAGEGVLHVGEEDRPLAPGSCLHLAPGTQHCLENTGQATLRVLGVFHPGGSPAAKKPATG
jgi:mannose-6-phosphate isomerase-like protein (cupin superfamily)